MKNRETFALILFLLTAVAALFTPSSHGANLAVVGIGAITCTTPTPLPKRPVANSTPAIEKKGVVTQRPGKPVVGPAQTAGDKPRQQPMWKYVFARTPASALYTINGGSSGLTIREPYITASVKDKQPIFHIFYHADYVAATPWKWKIKQIDKLNEVMDFLSYRNTFKNEPLHTQAKVVMVAVNGQNTFYIFYVTNDGAKSFAKDPWEGYFTNTPENVQAGINQNSVGNDGIPVNELEVDAVDKGFYYFYNSHKLKGTGSWGWTKVETPAAALNYLNTKYSNHPIEDPRIAAVQEPTQVVFYVFYQQ